MVKVRKRGWSKSLYSVTISVLPHDAVNTLQDILSCSLQGLYVSSNICGSINIRPQSIQIYGASALDYKSVFFQVHRLVVVNEDDRIEGVVSLSDILAFLVLRPLGKDALTRKISCLEWIKFITEDKDGKNTKVTTPISIDIWSEIIYKRY
jgi:hypothetical protein